MMDNESTPVFRFNFAAPDATAQKPEQRLIEKLDKHEPLPGDDDESAMLLPPPLEILPSEALSASSFTTDPVVFKDGFTLLKGRASTAKVIGVGTADLVPGKYEGGMKLWECTIDLVNSMIQEMKDGQLSFQGKRVLELGCGHGLPGIFAVLKGATTVHFQDFNAEVLRSLTIPNVIANIEHAQPGTSMDNGILSKSGQLTLGIHWYSGDWANVHELLSVSAHGHSPSPPGYDIILMSETVYSLPSLPRLYNLIKKCLRSQDGVLFVAGKKHYFGVGGGTRQFKSLVDKDDVFEGHLVADFADGSSNVREVWKFICK